jgi:hypothetical protein
MNSRSQFESSIAAWRAAGSNYDGQVAITRAQDAVTDNWAHPWDHDTKWEGKQTTSHFDWFLY